MDRGRMEELRRKRDGGALTSAEAEELDRLQAAFEKREPWGEDAEDGMPFRPPPPD